MFNIKIQCSSAASTTITTFDLGRSVTRHFGIGGTSKVVGISPLQGNQRNVSVSAHISTFVRDYVSNIFQSHFYRGHQYSETGSKCAFFPFPLSPIQQVLRIFLSVGVHEAMAASVEHLG